MVLLTLVGTASYRSTFSFVPCPADIKVVCTENVMTVDDKGFS